MARLLVPLVALFLLASPAGAERKRSPVEAARARYAAGEAAFRAGDYDLAIAEYEAAYGLSGRAALLFNIGSAYRNRAARTGSLDDKRQAVQKYERYLEASPRGRGVDDARRYIAALSSEIATAEEAARLAAAPPPPPPPPPEEAAPAPAPAPPAGPVAGDRVPRRGRGLRIAGVATGGAGVALLGLGLVFAFQARAASDDLSGLEPGDTWDAARYEEGQAANRNFVIATSVGAAAVTTGVVLYFLGGRRGATATPGPVSIVPTRGGAGVLVRGSF